MRDHPSQQVKHKHNTKPLTVWIDLANAPHVAFFVPIIHELERRGHFCLLTARRFNHTVELARLAGLDPIAVGKHGGDGHVGKLLNLTTRVKRLIDSVAQYRPAVAVSHNSYPQAVAGRIRRMPVLTIMDYEGQPANHIAFRAASKVIVPHMFPAAELRRFGARKRKTVRFCGFKEQVYLHDYVPLADALERLIRQLELPEEWERNQHMLITLRTPATMAAYHRFRNLLFDSLLERIGTLQNATAVLLCRNFEQERYYRVRFPFVHIPRQQLNGTELLYHSDYVFSAGGTINREAAILGVPAYTLFAGELPAVDRDLIALGRLHSLQCQNDIDSLRLEKQRKLPVLRNPGLVSFFADHIEAMGRGQGAKSSRTQNGRHRSSPVAERP
jgi:hypothetical protein